MESCEHSASRPPPKKKRSRFLPGCVSKLGVMDIRLKSCVKNPLPPIFIPTMTQREVCLRKLRLLLWKHVKDTAATCLYEYIHIYGIWLCLKKKLLISE